MVPSRSGARFAKARVVIPTQRRARVLLLLEQFEPRDVPSFVLTNYAAGAGAAAVAAADFQGLGNGNVDVATANIGANTVSVFLNNHDGTGTLQPAVNYTVGGSPVDIVAGDLTGDGLPDLVVSDSGSNTVTVLYNDPANPGTFLPRVGLFATGPAGSAPRDVRLADLNGDGFLDIVTANYGTDTVAVLLNQGDGNFAPAHNYPASSVGRAYALAVADFYGDGFPSVAVGIPGTGVTILRGNGDGTLQPFHQVANPGIVTGLAAGDLGNGSIDLVSANNNTGGITVLLNDGAGNFTAQNYAAGMTPLRVELADVNGDGALDVVTDNFLSAGPGNISIFYGNGDGTLQAAQNVNTGGDRPSGVAIADVEGDSAVDGLNDIIVTNNITGNVSVLLNSLGPIVVSTTLTGEINHPVSETQVVFSNPIDPNTFTPDQFALVDPNGNPVQVTGITPTDGTNTRFDVTFDTQSTLGTYTLTIGPNILDATDQYMMPAAFVGQFTLTNNLIINGGFETGNFMPWTQSGDTGSTLVSSAVPIHGGRFAAEFGPLNLGFIAQTVATVPGQTYQLSLWLAHPFTDTGTGTEYQVTIGGAVVDDQTDVGNFGYTQFTYTFTATDVTTTIQLGFKEPPNFFYLDDVSFTPVDAAPRAGGAKGVRADASAIAEALASVPGLALVPGSASRSAGAVGFGQKQVGGESAARSVDVVGAAAVAAVVPRQTLPHHVPAVDTLIDLLPDELSPEAAVTAHS